MEQLDIVDCNRYKKERLLGEVTDFVNKYDIKKFKELVYSIKTTFFIKSQQFPLYYEICD